MRSYIQRHRYETDPDPIQKRGVYLGAKQLSELKAEYGIEPIPILQCVGDLVVLPRNLIHQVTCYTWNVRALSICLFGKN